MLPTFSGRVMLWWDTNVSEVHVASIFRLCSVVVGYHLFRGPFCLPLQGADGGRMDL